MIWEKDTHDDGAILYVVYWGACEPLGQALVLPTVRRIAAAGRRVVLVSFEKPADCGDQVMQRTRLALEEAGIRWWPLRYHKRPHILSTLYDVIRGVAVAWRRSREFGVGVVHGRTFVGGLIGIVLKVILRRPFVYHNEGFWPDQQVEAGVWTHDGWPYRSAKWVEHRLYQNADGLLLLSEHSRAIVESARPTRTPRIPSAVVPSCVDLMRFRPRAARQAGRPKRLVYLGSLGGRYLIEPLGHFFRVLHGRDAEVTLTIASQSDASMIRSCLNAVKVPADAIRILRVHHDDVPALLADADLGLFFLQGGVGALSCSPTKIGEYWACGLPVVASRGLGDLDRVFEERAVGVLVDGNSEADYAAAAEKTHILLADPEVSGRCRRAAEELYDLEQCVATELSLYAAVAARRG